MRVKIRDAYQQIKTAEHVLNDGLKTLSTALQTIGGREDILFDNSLDNLPLSDLPITEHRIGRAPKMTTTRN